MKILILDKYQNKNNKGNKGGKENDITFKHWEKTDVAILIQGLRPEALVEIKGDFLMIKYSSEKKIKAPIHMTSNYVKHKLSKRNGEIEAFRS